MPIYPSRPLTGEWEFVATLTVDERPIDGNWDSVDGGDTSSDTRSYRAGGDVFPEALPASPTTGEVTLERAYRGGLDGSLRNWMADRIGRVARVKVYSMQPGGSPLAGTTETIEGILKEVTRPAFRSEGDGVALYRVVITPRGHWTNAG